MIDMNRAANVLGTSISAPRRNESREDYVKRVGIKIASKYIGADITSAVGDSMFEATKDKGYTGAATGATRGALSGATRFAQTGDFEESLKVGAEGALRGAATGYARGEYGDLAGAGVAGVGTGLSVLAKGGTAEEALKAGGRDAVVKGGTKAATDAAAKYAANKAGDAAFAAAKEVALAGGATQATAEAAASKAATSAAADATASVASAAVPIVGGLVGAGGAALQGGEGMEVVRAGVEGAMMSAIWAANPVAGAAVTAINLGVGAATAKERKHTRAVLSFNPKTGQIDVASRGKLAIGDLHASSPEYKQFVAKTLEKEYQRRLGVLNEQFKDYDESDRMKIIAGYSDSYLTPRIKVNKNNIARFNEGMTENTKAYNMDFDRATEESPEKFELGRELYDTYGDTYSVNDAERAVQRTAGGEARQDDELAVYMQSRGQRKAANV